MGIDFGNLIKNLGTAAAARGGKTDKIDSKQELKEYVSGWDKIKSDAKADSEKSGIVDLQAQAKSQAEIDALAKAELNEIMGLDFAKDLGIQKKVDTQKGAAFSDEDISLENLMSLLDDDVNTSKVAEHNKKPMLSPQGESIENLTNAGFEQELLAELIEAEPNVIQYMSNDIKSGRAKAISDNMSSADERFHELLDAGIDKPLKYVAERIMHNRAILKALKNGSNAAVEFHEAQKRHADNKAALNKLMKEDAPKFGL